MESELTDMKNNQSGIVEKNKSLIAENSKLIRKVSLLQRKGSSKSEISPLKKKLASPASRFSTEGIDIPVNMIQSSYASRNISSDQNSSSSSPLDYSLSDINSMDVDSDERFKRRAELEEGWVFIDVDVIPLPHLIHQPHQVVDRQQQQQQQESTSVDTTGEDTTTTTTTDIITDTSGEVVFE
jgi:hypothetical protein